MDKINPSFEKPLAFLVYSSLMVLALGVLTSTTLLAVSHIFMAIPALYFINKAQYKKFPKSAWALLALSIVIILSVVFNQDIAIKGYKPAFKVKYFLFGFLSIAPLSWYFQSKFHNDKKVTYLIYTFCIASSIATFSGLWGTFFGYNLLLMKEVAIGGRYGGIFGMVMNYAHNMSYFLIILLGLIAYKEKVKKYISLKWLIFFFVLNLIGFYFSYTRGAWLGFLVACPIYFFGSNRKRLLQVGLVVILAGVIAYFTAGNAMKRQDNDTTRVHQWKAALYAFKERSVLGYGYLNFEEHSQDIKRRYGLESLKFSGHAHNNFLEILASTGILGFVCYMLWLFFWVKESLRDKLSFTNIKIAFVTTFIVSGLTQSTISLGINLFFILGVFSLISIMNIKDEKLV
jgi:O-antigen ligase